ncbi:unnamed protein product, partial [Urochloa humidicola]
SSPYSHSLPLLLLLPLFPSPAARLPSSSSKGTGARARLLPHGRSGQTFAAWELCHDAGSHGPWPLVPRRRPPALSRRARATLWSSMSLPPPSRHCSWGTASPPAVAVEQAQLADAELEGRYRGRAGKGCICQPNSTSIGGQRWPNNLNTPSYVTGVSITAATGKRRGWRSVQQHEKAATPARGKARRARISHQNSGVV